MTPEILAPPVAPPRPAWASRAAPPAAAPPAAVLPALPRARFTWQGVLAIAGFYIVFAVLYAVTIAYTVQAFRPDPNAYSVYLQRVLLIDYPLKAAWTLPVWWLLFRSPLERASWPVKLLAHVVLAPAWVAAWFASYYGLLGLLGEAGIGGNGRAWDVYIPMLFYGVQFGMLHVARFTEQLQHRNRLAQQLQAQAHQSEMAALKAQINPHFLFNTLNSISASVPPELETTRELIARLAHTFRFALDASRHELLPLADELAFLRSYLELEQSRFGSRLVVSFEVEPGLERVPVPPMLLQPLVENAVKHGIGPLVEGGEISVQVHRAAAGLRCTVVDTGCGLPADGPTPDALLRGAGGIGLRNTHARLLALGSPGLVIRPNQPQGLQVSFVLPAQVAG